MDLQALYLAPARQRRSQSLPGPVLMSDRDHATALGQDTDTDWRAPPARAVRLHASCMALLFVAVAIAAVAIPIVAADRWGLGMKLGAATLWLALAAAGGTY